jgi:diguanylate cyclase (GGDEF)-like protein
VPKKDTTSLLDSMSNTITDVESPGKKRGSREACLVVIYGTDLGRRVPLTRSSFTIGRSSKSDLSIDQESVSRRHARISFNGRSHVIVDMRSKNGTYVNDELVAEKALKHGDQVKVGRSILKFMDGSNVEASYHEEIYRLMTVDGLTQIYNRRYFTEALERECNRAVRYKRKLSVALFDIDHFKAINDEFGHVAGDSVLRQLAAAVTGKLREQDIFARVGGEEFGVLLPEVGMEGARTTADKVRRVVETAAFTFEQAKIRCTLSAGVATAGDKPEPVALYRAADEALYRAKQKGRNRAEG